MADIEPYKQIKTTNIQEHNDLVGKINEIIEVINQTNLDTITPKIDKLEQDVSAINATDALQWNDIESIKTKNTEQDNTLATHATEIDGITKSLVSDVVLMNGTTTGNMKVRIDRKDAPSIDSDDYNIQKPTSVELVQGSAPAMVKAQITLSDGTVLISDDFMFTTEAIGTDVYISSFVFKNGNVAGTISADIGLSNGSTLTANNFVVPTDPNVTSAISDLQTRMTAVEGGSVGGLNELKATVDSHTTSINQLDTDVADLQIDKADVNNGNQSIVAGSISANNISKGGVAVATVNDIPVVPDISGKVDKAQGIENAGKVLGINASGNVEPTEVSSGEVWEEVDLNNFPADWVSGERIRLFPSKEMVVSATSWTSSPSLTVREPRYSSGPVIEMVVSSTSVVNLPFDSKVNDTSSPTVVGMAVINPAIVTNFNNNAPVTLFTMDYYAFNGKGCVAKHITITRTQISSYFVKIWRLKK